MELLRENSQWFLGFNCFTKNALMFLFDRNINTLLKSISCSKSRVSNWGRCNLVQKNIWNNVRKSSNVGPTKGFDIYFCLRFVLTYYQSLISRDWALSYVSTQIWDLSNVSWYFFSNIFLINLKSFSNSWGNLFTNFVIIDIKLCFTCGKSDLYWNIVKFRNIMARIVWEFFACSPQFLRFFKFLQKMVIRFKKVISIKNDQLAKLKAFCSRILS